MESAVGIRYGDGYTFYVNGKADGNAVNDAGTQIMLGLLGAILHEEAKTGLVIGLGSGESAGWLADVPSIERAIRELPGVTAVHDLHVWTIASGMVALSGHVVAGEERDPRKLLQDVADLLHDRFEIAHSTIQIESQDFDEPGGVCFT